MAPNILVLKIVLRLWKNKPTQSQKKQLSKIGLSRVGCTVCRQEGRNFMKLKQTLNHEQFKNWDA